jgi:adenylate cyclase
MNSAVPSSSKSETAVNGVARPRHYSVVQLLAGLLILVLLAAMSLIAVVQSYFTRRSVQELSDRIVQQTLARVELRIGALLDQAMNQNEQGKLLLEGEQLSAQDFKLLGGFFAHSLTVLSELSYLGFGLDHNGDYIFAERLPDDSVRVREYVLDETGQRVIRDWRWRGSERELLKVQPWDGYDPRQRPFYQRALAARTNAWTDTYAFWKGNERGSFPGVTFVTPFYDTAGKLVGVLNSDFDLTALCRFLAEQRVDVPGYAFVVERRQDGSLRLIAHPDETVLSSNESGKKTLNQLPDRAAAAFIEAALTDGPQRQKLTGGRSITFHSGEQRFFGSAHFLKRPGEPPWIVAVIIPVRDVMGGVYANDRRALYMGLGCLVATALLAVWIARKLGEPLYELTREAQAIRRLELSARTEVPSQIREVSALATAMSEMKSSLRSFQKFVPVDVVRELVTTATEARLGGSRLTITMFFSDVADFTTLAERMSPESLIEHIGEYLGAMSNVIHAGGGTVDKFIGDGIMAFWGAPRPNPNHAQDACRTALEYQRALARLRERWREQGKSQLRARIGLHTGAAIVGNIGSEERLNYTSIGDAVNLTSRLEGLNRFYGTEILISAACASMAGDTIITRPVDNLSVKGRTGELVVHELLAMADSSDDSTRQIARSTAEAFAAYMRRDFTTACEMYLALFTARPSDSVAKLMARRCEEISSAPRPESWDTTFHMKEK